MHCYMNASVSNFAQLLPYLMPTYRVVCFDNCGWGLNSRVDDCSGLASAEAANAWLLEQTK